MKVSMDGAVLAILLLTGFCVLSSSFPNVYDLSNKTMIWKNAQNYCISEYFATAEIQNGENVTTNTTTDNAWKGLCLNDSVWTWTDGKPSQQNFSVLCKDTGDDGNWTDASCSDMRPCVCYKNDTESYVILRGGTNSSCTDKQDVLVSFSDATIESLQFKSLQFEENTWIGLVRLKRWIWSKDNQNWPPDDRSGTDNCAIVLRDGKWAESQCDPTSCIGVRKTVVRIKIQSGKNMEDPANSAALLQQMRVELDKQGVTNFKLTWKKLPAKMLDEAVGATPREKC